MENRITGAADSKNDGARKLRVCMLIPKLQVGGAEVQVLYLLKNLDRSIFSISLCCFKGGIGEKEREAERYVDSYYVIEFRWRFFPSAFFRLVRYLRKNRFDILHCHLPLADSIGRLAGWMVGVPVLITTEHGKHLWKSFPHRLFERFLNRITDARICVSRDILELRARREGTTREKLRYIPNAVDPESFRTPVRGRAAVMADFGWTPDDPLVISVGRLVSAKNYPLLVESIARLKNRFPNIRCLIVGEGGCRGEISDRIGSLGAGGQITLAGVRDDIIDLLAAADVFALSSVREGLPVSLLEAMAAGKAIVATSVGGIPDAIKDGENGFLVPPGDSEGLASSIEKLLGDIELRRRLGKAATKTIEEKFSMNSTAKQTQELYIELYKSNAGGTAE